MSSLSLRFVDWRDEHSLSARLRRKRSEFFKSLFMPLPRPLTILDVGGLPTVWERLGLINVNDIHITLLNTEEHSEECAVSYSNFTSVVGDARDMRQFKDREFDIAYSNSVIEHVGSEQDRQQMACEIRRVAARYFVQTPYRYFPIEPHFVFPMFQFLPRPVQLFLLQNYRLGWNREPLSRKDAESAVDSIYLLSAREIKDLFPDAEIKYERFGGLVKSVLAYRMQ